MYGTHLLFNATCYLVWKPIGRSYRQAVSRCCFRSVARANTVWNKSHGRWLPVSQRQVTRQGTEPKKPIPSPPRGIGGDPIQCTHVCYSYFPAPTGLPYRLLRSISYDRWDLPKMSLRGRDRKSGGGGYPGYAGREERNAAFSPSFPMSSSHANKTAVTVNTKST